MPRKTRVLARSAAGTGRFNEAAARCRGKPLRGGGGSNRSPEASMRPRPDAAENLDAHVAGTLGAALQ